MKTLIETFNRQGYLVLNGIFDHAAITELGRFAYGQLGEQFANFKKQTGVDMENREAVKAYADTLAKGGAFEALPRELQHLVKGEFPLDVRMRKEFLLVAQTKKLNELLRALLNNGNIRMHYPSMIRFKMPGQKQAQVPMHQDHGYFTHLENFINAWVPLCDITDECGGVNVLEGSQRLGPLPHKQSPLWGAYVDEGFNPADFKDIHVTMKIGDVLLFGPHMLHYTHANTSAKIRCSIDSRWFPGTTTATRRYYDDAAGKIVEAF